MKTIIQKVIRASISVEKKYYEKINKGLLCYVAFRKDDNITDILRTINKISKLKIFDSQKSVNDIKGEILVVSQFTLYAEIKKGSKPSFSRAANRQMAEPLYKRFLLEFNRHCPDLEIRSGIFGEDMKIESVNDGPFTLCYDTDN
tara:strand:- start:415 stop:849 length:435 start_codon:yes stop_codon:yes gene_type:complete